MTIGERIRIRRKEISMSADVLAEKLNVSRSTIFRYENGDIEKLPIQLIETLAEALNTTPDFLMGWENTENFLNEVKRIIKIPVLGTITCGDPILAEENISSYIAEVEELLPKGELFYLKTKGNSMMPTIPENSFVLIRKQEMVENNEIAAVLVNGDTEATLKRINFQGDSIILMPDNIKEHTPIIVNEENPARIIGKAIKISIDL